MKIRLAGLCVKGVEKKCKWCAKPTDLILIFRQWVSTDNSNSRLVCQIFGNRPYN